MEFEELCLSITADFHAELNSASMPKSDEDSFVVEDDSVSTSELADIVVPEQKTRTGQKKANKRKQSKNSEQKIQKKKTKLSSNLEAESAPEIIDITELASSSNMRNNGVITEDMIREALENFVIADCQPFTLVENRYFLTLLNLCLHYNHTDCFIPKADALKSGIMKRVQNLCSNVAAKLNALSTIKIHCALDVWTSPNNYTFLAITCHYIDANWCLGEDLLCLVDTVDHSGDALAGLVHGVLKTFDICSRIGCITGDNASNNDTLCKSLSERLSPTDWNPQEHRIRCFAHIVNLSCQKFLSVFQSKQDLDAENLEIPLEESGKTISNLLRRVRFFIKKLRCSPQQRNLYELQCKAANLSCKMLILDVKTRWNSTFYMIERLIEQKRAVEYWLSTNPECGKIKMGYLKPSDDEWKLLEEIMIHLKVFEESSRLLSGSKYPTLSLVMPAYIELFTYIENQMSRDEVSQMVKEALTDSHSILSKYYNFTDDSVYYLGSVILDPRFKLEYLNRKSFDTLYPEVLRETLEKLKSLSNLLQESRLTTIEQKQDVSTEVNVKGTGSLFERMFAHTAAKSNDHELDAYLALQTEAAAVDPLQWWKSHEVQFPALSKLAKSMLAIPGSSVSVERVFNVGRDVIGLRRHALDSDSTSSLMLGNHYLRK